MAVRTKKTKTFEALTWADLEAWAGSKILSRGKSYHRQGRVKNLAKTTDGQLIAWVDGSERYATIVYFDGRNLESVCTCPYWADCKHAVATMLEYLECAKSGTEIPPPKKNDPRLRILEEDLSKESYEEETMGGESKDGPLDEFLNKQNKKKLVEILNDLAARYPDVRSALMDRQALTGGAIKGMVDRIRSDIQDLTADPVYRHYWNDDSDDLPDYSRVEERLEALLKQGHGDEVLSLGKDLLVAGTEQVGMSHDDGGLSWDIGQCMEIAFKALSRSSLSTAEQMHWAVEAELMDEYNLCDEGLKSFWKNHRKKADWAVLAERLMEHLSEVKTKKGEDSRNYRRERLTDWIVEALGKAGKTEKAVALCEKEAPVTASYVRLVRLLREAGRNEDAMKWIHKGIHATQKKWPGIASDLRRAFREMQEKDREWSRVAAIRAEDFFMELSLHTFKDLEKAAKKAKVWQEVRVFAMAYLESGRMLHEKASWPLPETGLPKPIKRRKEKFPLIDTLIDIAIAEKRPDDVLKWYDLRSKENRHGLMMGHRDDKIAEAIKGHYPERALGIWKGIAEGEIALTKVKAYQEAARTLQKIRKLFKDQGKGNEWERYASQLRQIHARKQRFVEILDSLSGRRIVDG